MEPDPQRVREADLVRKCKAGEEAAFSELVKLHKEKAVQIVYMTIGNYEDAKDVAQEAFVKAFRAIERFDERSKFSTWFYRILMNASKDFLRRKKWKTMISWQSDEKMTHFLESIEDPYQTAESVAVNEELKQQIKQAIEALPQKQRWMFTLRFVEGLSIAEISQVANVSQGTVKAALHFAAKKFKAAIQPYVKS